MVDISQLPGHLIRRMHQISVARFQDEVAEAGHKITPVQFAVLHTIDENPSLGQMTLAKQITYDQATIGGVVDRLVEKGLVERIESPRDRRAKELTLTGAGRALHQELLPLAIGVQPKILSRLNDAERQALTALLTKAVGPSE